MRAPAIAPVLVVLAVSGCLGASGGAPPETDELRDSSVDATENLSAYRYNVSTTVEVTLVGADGSDSDGPTITFFLDGGGAVDRDEREMEVETKTTTRSGTGVREATTEVRLLNGTVYATRDGGGWERSNASFDAVWEAHDAAAVVGEALGADVSSGNGTVTVGGNEAYRVDATGHGEDRAEAVLERVRLYLQTVPEGGANVTDAEVGESSATVWVGADDRYPLRTESETVFDATMETEAGEVETRLSVESTRTFRDHGAEVDVEAPEVGEGTRGVLPFGL